MFPHDFLVRNDWDVKQGLGNNGHVQVSVFILYTTLIFLRVEHLLHDEYIYLV